ncbi:hypothetical protein M5689_020466 [Euphorbia peplus]|nr:hypothetical protein M5689_020466 [Euphorbia peplus]
MTENFTLETKRSYFQKEIREAAVSVAYTVAEAENKSYLADEDVKEAEQVLEIAENTYATLQLVKEIHEQCSLGEIFLLA